MNEADPARCSCKDLEVARLAHELHLISSRLRTLTADVAVPVELAAGPIWLGAPGSPLAGPSETD